jgi:hypothetical protein
MAADKQPEITLVAPNGATLPENYHSHERVGKVLAHAVVEFGRRGDLDPALQYILVLGDRPLDDGLTLEEAGVKPGDTLKVRSKTIPGDGSASRTQ